MPGEFDEIHNKKASVILGIPADFVRKDFFVTKAIKQYSGFSVPDNAVNVLYEGRFMQIKADFGDSKKITYLRPHIEIDCFFGELALMPDTKNISTLTKLILGDECPHSYFPVKWVALTRRIAGSKIKPTQSDKHLVRHLYDLNQLKTGDYLTGEYSAIIKTIIQKDQIQFKNHNPDYIHDPIGTSEQALSLLFQEMKWRDHWSQFLEQMVYGAEKPDFDAAYEQLQQITLDIFNEIK